MKQKTLIILSLIVSFVCIFSCQKNSQITPEDFPKDLGIEGFTFPEDSMQIYGWVENRDTMAITEHAWGIWAGLTKPTNQTYSGQKLLVFETWHGVQELAAMSAQGLVADGETPKSTRTKLQIPRQFSHATLLTSPGMLIDTNFSVLETVSYDPSASKFVTQNKLFNQSVLEGYRQDGQFGSVPDFPSTSITTKPTYYAGVPDKRGLIRVPVWEEPSPAKAYKYTQWQSWVYVDISNTQKRGKNLYPVRHSNPSPDEIAEATCNLSDFIHHKIDRAAADYLNSHQDVGTTPSRQFVEGDYILLVAMHVTTKEFKNWTWQTYFWTADPSNPPKPSSRFEASLRPNQVVGAAAHYAVSTAYAMVWPNQPVSGGSDRGCEPIIAYNPYLEGGFGPKVFKQVNKFRPDFVYGMQTNCMSCHALSTLSGKNGYTTNQYIDMNDSALFLSDVKLDFTWSIQGNINTDK